ncbi:MAG: HD domain-containing protein [Pseudomonadota bacterium]
MTTRLDEYLAWFEAFALEFTGVSSEDDTNIKVKIDHTIKVLEVSKQITAALDLPAPLARLTHMAALFHDVGRFPQYAQFRTFNDRTSANHARLGVDTLRKRGVLSDCTPEHRRLVLGAVFLHNRRSVPSGISSNLDLITRIVRDADKLDIIRVMLAHLEPGAPLNGVVTLGLKPHPSAYTTELFAKVRRREQVPYEEMVWINDYKLLLCSWCYHLNFPVSLRILEERKYLDGIFGSLRGDSELQALEEQMRQDLLSHSRHPGSSSSEDVKTGRLNVRHARSTHIPP